jgi:membrane protein YqaA with SNARE-associated domain
LVTGKLFTDYFENLVNENNFFLSPIGLFIITFIEASFSPIPPEVLLIPLCIIDPENAIFYGIIATIASVLGALLGYWIGLKGGRPLARRFVKPNQMKSVENYFNNYGAWAIGLAALTPIPFKVFTITAGTLKFKSIPKFILASAVGRAGRFIPESIFLILYRRAILDFMLNTFQIMILVIVALIAFLILFIKKFGLRLNLVNK